MAETRPVRTVRPKESIRRLSYPAGGQRRALDAVTPVQRQPVSHVNEVVRHDDYASQRLLGSFGISSGEQPGSIG